MADLQRFAWDSYRRLVQMVGSAVMGVDGALFEDLLRRIKDQHHAAEDTKFKDRSRSVHLDLLRRPPVPANRPLPSRRVSQPGSM
ncbi:hypothetical protein [Streptomyces sp. NPDC059460]|uniref:hypothetical protein n=1 Tax=Streptomyces sp. NPDC059460 TaxID=3346840 RepID=UPI00369DD865